MTSQKDVEKKGKVLVDDPAASKPENPTDSYEGRKYDKQIDGPQHESQETDEVYADPRKEENIPDGGKKVDELDAHDLSKKDDI